jgi:hypothetical protein
MEKQLSYHGFAAVDPQAKTLTGVVMCRVGPAYGHGEWVDQLFIDKLVELGQSSQLGIKVRFGHPPMCQDAIGTELGLAHNWRVDGERALADLTFIETPENAKKIAHIIKYAAEAPHTMGNSIEFCYENRKDEEGEDETYEHEGHALALITPTKLTGTAMVSDPAATEGVFTAQKRLDAGLARKWLASNRGELVAMLAASPELNELVVSACMEAAGVDFPK